MIHNSSASNTSQNDLDEEPGTLTDIEVTSEMLDSTLANTKSVLGVYYQYSSYDDIE